MFTRLSRSGLALLMVAVLAGFGLATSAQSAGADTIVPINWTVNATTTLKNLDLSVAVPPGTFSGQVDLTTGAISGDLSLPAASKTISFAGISLATATFSMSEAGPISGHVDLSTMTADVTSSFNFSIKSATLSLLPHVNLVGSSCRGTTPITVEMTGPISLTGSQTFTSTYTIPKLTGCGLLTPILNLVVPSSGNTFSATFAPST